MESSSSFSLPNDDKSSYDNLDLPFLITHWLTRYSGGNVGGSSGDHTSTKRNNNFNIADPAPMPSAAASNDVGGEGRELLRLTQRQSKIFEGINEENVNANISDTIAKHEPQKQIAEAMDRIRRATSELACAFSDLGAFGSTIAPSFQSNNCDRKNSSVVRNATYSDMTRRWDTIPRNHLQTLLQSAQSSTNAVLSERMTELTRNPISLVDAAYERCDGPMNDRMNGANGGRIGSNGHSRAVAGAIAASNEGTNRLHQQFPQQQEGHYESVVVENSILHNPILLTTPVIQQIAPSRNNTQRTIQLQTPSSRTNNSVTAVNTTEPRASDADIKNITNTTITIGSDYQKLDKLSSNASRRYLNIKKKFLEEEQKMRQLKKSLQYQKNVLHHVDEEISNFLTSQSACASVVVAVASRNYNGLNNNGSNENIKMKSDTLAHIKNEANRVIAQLHRKLDEVSSTHDDQTKNELRIAHCVSRKLWDETMNIRGRYIDTYDSCTYQSDYTVSHATKASKRNSILSHVVSRNYGIGSELGSRGRHCGVVRRKAGMRPTQRALCQRYDAMLTNRISHVMTINCHLYFPVYCLRFDRTGQYFVTGADDNLVKLFRLGFPHCEGKRQEQASKLSDYNKRRGAVLVCTFRGHASVITDIDISSDNTLLATASEDGDVRVWGMTDGCPVAILRGHAGGANMVSWSTLTPYRLVTVGEDGLARIWDIREAALKRCRAVRSRVDYTLPKLQNENGQAEEEAHKVYCPSDVNDDVMLPPLPASLENSNGGESQPVNMNNNLIDATHMIQIANGSNNGGRIYVPPLPAGAEHGVGAQEVGNGGLVPGSFVANDEIDEGVKLLSKLQHGELPTVEQMGTSTRSRRKKVNVTCVARCPIGGHFATGSDDGIGRIWADYDDIILEKLDDALREDNSVFFGKSFTNLLPGQKSDSLNRTRSSSPGSNVVPSSASLLTTLYGHHKAITDIKYSNGGDRLLTASQKDGVVRIWSWGTETAKKNNGSVKIDQVRQIFLRMVPPPQCKDSAETNSTAPSRRRSASSSKSKLQVHCDMATWTSDDRKIITSQSCLSNTNGTDIVPGSQIIHVWDSRTGQCIIGLPSVHNKPCSVLISHPVDPSIIVSAGGDGYARVWNLNTGRCLYSHRNIHQYGSVANLSDRGKDCGYLDGSFSPDGLNLVLTDDQGRITIIDTLQPEEETKCNKDGTSSSIVPHWMREQYFANDYYELFYDTNGYCIERGSRQPPHLAPEAAICNHTGSAYGARLQEALSTLPGPMPIYEKEVRANRDKVRIQSFQVRKAGGTLAQNVRGKRTLIEAYPSVSSYIVDDDNIGTPEKVDRGVINSSPTEVRAEARARSSARTLSSRYNWIGYEEAWREDDGLVDEAESDYEDNVRVVDRNDARIQNESPASPRRRRRNNGRNSNNVRTSNNSRNSARQRRQNNRNATRREVERFEEVVRNEPSRTSARQSARRSLAQQYNDSDSEGSVIEEMLSANTSPAGEYIRDYIDLGHLFKIPSGGMLNREWVSRIDCIEGYTGWKTYAPQVGDSVVYIPKAHSDTLQAYPICNNSSTGAPWKSWPTNSHWPVVQCEVKDIRYRFPYNGYFGRGSSNPIESVIMILSLEMTGIPLIDPDRGFNWPKPEFVSRKSTRSSAFSFEVSLFVNGEADFILPLGLFQWRVRQLEEAAGVAKDLSGVSVTDFYFDEKKKEDATFDPYDSKIGSMQPAEEEDEFHFQHSGFNSLTLIYSNGDADALSIASPWEVSISSQKYNCPLPPCLTDAQKGIISTILDELEEDAYVLETFSAPVDTRQFVDYYQMIEVPMYILKIRNRLKNDYYTNIYSVRSDMKLICDNCLKYNKEDSDVSKEAERLLRNFSELFDEKLQDLATMIGTRDPSNQTIKRANSTESQDLQSTPRSDAQRRSTRSSQQILSPESQISAAESRESNDIYQGLRVRIGNQYVTGNVDRDGEIHSQEVISSPENQVGVAESSEHDLCLRRVIVGNYYITGRGDEDWQIINQEPTLSSKSPENSDFGSFGSDSSDDSSELSGYSQTLDMQEMPKADKKLLQKATTQSATSRRTRSSARHLADEVANDHGIVEEQSNENTRRLRLRLNQKSKTESPSTKFHATRSRTPRSSYQEETLCDTDDDSSHEEQKAILSPPTKTHKTSSRPSRFSHEESNNLCDTDNNSDKDISQEEMQQFQSRSYHSTRRRANSSKMISARPEPVSSRATRSGGRVISQRTPQAEKSNDSDNDIDNPVSRIIENQRTNDETCHSTRVTKQVSPSTPTRSSRRSISKVTYKDLSDSEREDISESEWQSGSNRGRSKMVTMSSKRKRSHTNQDMESPGATVRISPRRSPRKSNSTTPSFYVDKSGPLEDKQQTSPKRTTRSTRRDVEEKPSPPRAKRSSPLKSVDIKNTRTSPRASRQVIPSYQEYSDSDFSEIDDEVVEELDDNDEVTVEITQTQRNLRKRPRVESPGKANKKKVKRRPKKTVPLPTIRPWSSNHIKNHDIAKICTSILDKLVVNDTTGEFHSPVVEQFPEIADKYRNKIKNPMDFSTIRKRIPTYRVMADFQNDVILVFQNCCNYHKPGTKYWNYARENWEYIETAFIQALEENNIPLPRRGYKL